MVVPLFSGDITMRICERETIRSQVVFREARRLSDNGHQTAIITTNRIIDIAQVAAKMIKYGRTLLKEIFTSIADIFPDYENKTMTVVLYSMSSPRRNRAVPELCTTLNETQIIYPQTERKINFKSISI